VTVCGGDPLPIGGGVPGPGVSGSLTGPNIDPLLNDISGLIASLSTAALEAQLFNVDSIALKAYGGQFSKRLRNGDIFEDCVKDIVNLQITPEQWADALDNVSVLNGPTSAESLAGTLPVGSIERQVAQDRNLTVGGQFGPGTVAWSSANDNRVWINPFYVNAGDALEGSSLIAHETLHNLGLIDSVIQGSSGLMSPTLLTIFRKSWELTALSSPPTL